MRYPIIAIKAPLEWLFLILCLTLFFACSKKTRGELRVVDHFFLDDNYYYNPKLDLKIGAKYHGWEHKLDHFEEDWFYPKELGLLKIEGFRFREILHYMRQFDRFAIFTERYGRRLDSSLVRTLEERGFTNIEIQDITNNHLSYEKRVDDFRYFVEEKTIQKQNDYIRYIAYFRIPLIADDSSTHLTSTRHIDFEKTQRSDMLNFSILYDLDDNNNPVIDLKY